MSVRLRRRFAPLLLLVFHLTGCSSGEDAASPAQSATQICRGGGGAALARVYAIAVSYPANVPDFVQQNAMFYRADGSAIRCGRVLASQLLNAALSGPSPDSVREQAADVAGRAGRPELGPSVADSMLENQADLYLLAGYVQNLVDTLPGVAEGDLTPYQSTAVYQNSAMVWTMIESIGALRHKGPS